MAITKFGPRSMKGQSRFRGNPKSALQIKTCLEYSRGGAAASLRTTLQFPSSETQALVNSRRSR